MKSYNKNQNYLCKIKWENKYNICKSKKNVPVEFQISVVFFQTLS